MTIDKTITKLLISEAPDRIDDIVNLMSASEKIQNMVIQAIGPLALLLLEKHSVKDLRLICAFCYLIGYDQAKAKILEDMLKEK